MKIIDRFKRSWNAFLGRDPTFNPSNNRSFMSSSGSAYSGRPDRVYLRHGSYKSIVSTIFNIIAVDCSSITLNHVRVDENNIFVENINSYLNDCLTISANIDQTGRQLISDLVISMFDEGYVALVPVVADTDPNFTESYEIYELRVGKIKQWYPHHVKVEIYDEDTGKKREKILSKGFVAIIENPFYYIMNEPNSLAQRLMRTMAQLESINAETAANKLDLIIQFPFPIKSEARKIQAEERRNTIINQLKDSAYGIAYIDTSEKITPLNRSLENNLYTQVKELTQDLYNQFGLTEEIFNGKASEEVQLNYYNRTIDPIMATIATEIERKFLSKTARSQGQAIRYYRDPFRLVPVKNLADIADRFTRNEIMSSNEIRAVIGMKPSDDPRADELINSNINHDNDMYGMQNAGMKGEEGMMGAEGEEGMENPDAALEGGSQSQPGNLFDTSQIDPNDYGGGSGSGRGNRGFI